MKVKSDHHSKFFQFKQLERRSLKKIRASTGFKPMTSAIPVRCSTNWAIKPHIGSEVNLLSSYLPVQWNDVKFIWNNSYLYCGCRWKNWKIYCDDHSSLSSTTAVQIWIISYKLHIITPAYHILLFQTMFLVAFYVFFEWVTNDPWATTFRRVVSVPVWSTGRQTLSSRITNITQTGPSSRDSALQFSLVEFLLSWCRVRRSNSGSLFCLADGSAVKTEVFTRQLKGALALLWFRLFQLQFALFSYWCS